MIEYIRSISNGRVAAIAILSALFLFFAIPYYPSELYLVIVPAAVGGAVIVVNFAFPRAVAATRIAGGFLARCGSWLRERVVRKPESQRVFPGSAAWFEARFNYAFPGIRETQVFRGTAAVKRLTILLAEPLTVKTSEHGYVTPAWWWRGGNLQIESFQALGGRRVLMNNEELKICRIAALYNRSYRRLCVYVEAEGERQSGVYSIPVDGIARMIAAHGYAWEEFGQMRVGLFKRLHQFPSTEYDDGAFTLGGKIIRLHGRGELRVRYLSRYNFVIAPVQSPINNNYFDATLASILDGILRDTHTIEDLQMVLSGLPENMRAR